MASPAPVPARSSSPLSVVAPAEPGAALPEMTVDRALRVPVLRAGAPTVVAGHTGLGRPVRWVHTTELVDVAPLLRGGDLVLSTGIALPDGPDQLAAFARSLDRCGAAGLVIELGRRWSEVPGALVEACDRLGLPLVALAREVRFAAVGQVIGEMIVDGQLAELHAVQQVHEVFTELGMSEAGPAEVLDAVHRLTGATVVLEDAQHRLVDYRSGCGESTTALVDWQRRSRAVVPTGRTVWDEATGWLLTRVGRPDRAGGRVVLESQARPTSALVATVERAAAAIASHAAGDRRRDSAVRRTHDELVAAVLRDPSAPGLEQRCELAGVPVGRRRLVGLTVRPLGVEGQVPARRGAGLDAVLSAVVHAAEEGRCPALVATVDGDVRVLLPVDRWADAEAVVDGLAARVHRSHRVVVGAGTVAESLASAAQTLKESRHVVDGVRDTGSARVVHRIADVHVRGLLEMVADDERVQLFVARELDGLREHDARWQAGLLDAVRALLLHPGSKSGAAASLHMSRPAFYDRLTKVERLLGASLDDPDVRLSLHLALVADEVLAARTDGP